MLTYFEIFIKIRVRANGFFSTKNTQSSKLVFQHFSTYHALQPDLSITMEQIIEKYGGKTNIYASFERDCMLYTLNLTSWKSFF